MKKCFNHFYVNYTAKSQYSVVKEMQVLSKQYKFNKLANLEKGRFPSFSDITLTYYTKGNILYILRVIYFVLYKSIVGFEVRKGTII